VRTKGLVAHQSMDDAIGTRHPGAPDSLRFAPDGTLLLRAHCNRGQGRWLERRDGCQASPPPSLCVARASAQRLRELSARPGPGLSP